MVVALVPVLISYPAAEARVRVTIGKMASKQWYMYRLINPVFDVLIGYRVSLRPCGGTAVALCS